MTFIMIEVSKRSIKELQQDNRDLMLDSQFTFTTAQYIIKYTDDEEHNLAFELF